MDSRRKITRRLTTAVSVLLTLVLALATAGNVSAAPADFDTTFGSGGMTTYAVAPAEDSAFGVALQSDGKIVAAGRAYLTTPWTGFRSVVTRFNPDGSIDPTFAGGFVTASIGSTRDESLAVEVQTDNKILAAGFTDGGPTDAFGLIRLKTDGAFDSTTFAAPTGKAYFWFGTPGSSNSHAHALALQPDGRILLAGYTDTGGTADFAIVRANTDGTPDTTFDSDGKVLTPIGSSSDRANAIAVQPDGKLLVAGETDAGATGFDLAITRYNSDGSLDPTFSGDGMTTADVSGGEDDYIRSIALRSDGTIVAAGYSSVSGVTNALVARFTASGALDGGFGIGGVTKMFLPGGETRVDAISLQNNDKFVVSGNYYDGAYTEFLVAQYNSSGTPDQTFDGDGILMVGHPSADDHGRGVVVQPDGKIVVAGFSNTGANFDFSLLRLAGELPVPTPTALIEPATPTSSIASPRGNKVKRRKLRGLSGTAGPTGLVAKVEIALRRIDRRALNKKRCLWLRNAKAKFIKTRAAGKRCKTPHFMRARGTESWSYKFRRKLPKGRYELSVRATLNNGTTQTEFKVANGNFRAFTVT